MQVQDLLPLTSSEYLWSLFNNVFLPLNFVQSSNIITFNGAGKWVNIKFIIDNVNVFDPKYPQCAYLYVDSENLSFSSENEIKNGFMFMLSKATIQKNTLVQEFLEKEMQSTESVESQLFNLMRLLNQNNQKLVIIVDNAHLLTIKDRKAQLAISVLLSIYNSHITRTGFIFLTKGEVEDNLSTLRGLEILYSQHIVTESEIPHDKKCIDAYLKRIKENKGISLTEVAIDKITDFSVGDPLIFKYIIQEYAIKENLRKLFDSKNSLVNEIYMGLNTEYLDDHFEQIIATLKSASKDFLFGISKAPTKYLIDSALVINGKPMNLSFDYYLKYRGQRYLNINLETTLTPQENRVFELLSDSLGKMVTRDLIAESLWGENWKSRYSEQGIDKSISNIRAKLKNSKYTVVSAKGQGVILERN